MRKIAYLAIDAGSKATVQALASQLPGLWLTEAGAVSSSFMATIGDREIDLLVCGTSDSLSGRTLEAAARRDARKLGIPTILIEDFPGNYQEVPEGRAQLLFVDSQLAADLAREKTPDRSLQIHICPSIRYDHLRRRIGELRTWQGTRRDAVLWIGQPETGDSLASLECLLPALEAASVPLWFRAHPRDEGYARGAYAKLLSRAQVRDLTAAALDQCLRMGPALVATQFSSVAIEAGFWGIPALNVLLPDAGAARLAAKKGYAVPPWCEEGAAFLIRHRTEAHSMLSMALGSPQARARALKRFDRYFSVHEEGSKRLINVLYNHGFL